MIIMKKTAIRYCSESLSALSRLGAFISPGRRLSRSEILNLTKKRATRKLKKMEKVLFQHSRKIHLAWKAAKPSASNGVTLRTIQSKWLPRLLYPMHHDD
jgi:hypothetical protein